VCVYLLSRAEAYAWVLFLFVGFILLYICMWQPRGSAPEWRDDVMAVMIRFSPMTRDVSRAGCRPTIYRRLAISLRSPAIILLINYSIILPHPCVQPYLLIYSHTRPYTDIQHYSMPPHDLLCPTTDQCPMWSLTADSVHRETPSPVVGGNNPCQQHLYWPGMHMKIRNV